MRQFALHLYSRLLRLYPASFRAEYAEEMRTVFACVLNESDHALLTLLAELRDLPISVLQAHLRERRAYQLPSDGGAMMFQRLYSPRLFQFSAYIIFTLFLIYALSILSAYFVFDMRSHSLQNAYDWWYAIGNQAPYAQWIGLIGLVLLIIYLLILPATLIFGGVLGLNLWRQWYRLPDNLRRMGIIALSSGLLILLSFNSELVYIGSLWFYD